MRYLFKDQTGKFNTSRGRSRSSNIIATEAPILVAPRFGRTLVSDTTRLQSALVTNISTAISIKFSLLFNFGAFLLEIPRRLGCNEALDAASKCLIAAYEPYCAGQREATYTSLLEYNRALVTLRRCLADPSTARTSETICSVMLLMMAQVCLIMSSMYQTLIRVVVTGQRSQPWSKSLCWLCSDFEVQRSVRSTNRLREKALFDSKGPGRELSLFYVGL